MKKPKSVANFEKDVQAGLLEERSVVSFKNYLNKVAREKRSEGHRLAEKYLLEGGVRLTAEQAQKGLVWLKKPANKKHLGNREISVIESQDARAYLTGFQDAGNGFFAFFVPVYEYESSQGSFTYYVSGGKAHIIG